MDEFQPVERIVIDDLKTLQILSHPLRSQILEMFGDQAATVKQVANRLGLTASKLYYHVNLLEEHGLLRIVETRTVGNMIEKRYRTAADHFKIKTDLLSFTTSAGREGAEQMVVSTLDTTREDLLRSMEARRLARAQGAELEPRQAIVNRCLSRVPDARAEEFRARLCALMEEFGEADEEPSVDEIPEDDGKSEAQTYALTIAYYATWTFPDRDES